MAKVLKRITDIEHLKTQSKDYVITRNFGIFPAHNEKTVRLIIPDKTQEIVFEKAPLRIETKENCQNVKLSVWLNGNQLKPCTPKTTTLFLPLAKNKAYVGPEVLQFYTVPLDALIAGDNEIKISNPDPKKNACTLYGMELALYR